MTSRGSISITGTMRKHNNVIQFLTVIHAISGCQCVPGMSGSKKATALTVSKEVPLRFIGRLQSSDDESNVK